ncbi:MAG: RidA family protein [Nitriliruptoraceae bacterium]
MARRQVDSGGPWEVLVGYSRVVRVGDHVVISGTTAIQPDGSVVGEGDVAAQAREVFRRIAAALEAVDASLADVVRTRTFVTDISQWEVVGRVHGEVFGQIRPAATMVEVSRLITPGLLVEIEADAIVQDGH